MELDTMFLQNSDKHDADIYYCHWQSVLAGFQQIVKEIKELGISNDIEIMNIDDFADIHEIPMNDFIILRHFNLDINDGNVEVSFNVGISTYSDANNHRLAKLISYVYGRYMTGKAQYVLDEEGEVKATLTSTDGTFVNLMSKSEMRSTQYITVVALSTATPSLYPD